jgi:hypothetical protein
MDKSNTVNKQTVEQAILDAVKHIKNWTKQELSNLLARHKFSKDTILIIPIGHAGYLIGNYALRHVSNEWHMIYRYNDQELVFHNRNAAMFYAICQQTSRISLADQIYNYDQQVHRLDREVDHFRIRIKRSSKKRERDIKQLYDSRYQESVLKLKHARFLLEKTLQMAKY